MEKIKWNPEFISKVGKTSFKKLTSQKVGSGGPVSFISKMVEVASKNPAPKTIEDDYMNLVLDPVYSGRTFRVYFNAEKKVAFFLHSPTDPSEFEDIIADILLALSVHSSRIKTAIKKHIEAEEKYLKLGYKISVIGYSLGAYISSQVAPKSRAVDFVLIAQPLVPSNIRDDIPKNMYRIRSVKDGVNFLYPIAKHSKKDINIKAESNNPISEHQAKNVLPRLNQKRMIGIDLKGGGSKLKNEIDEFKKQMPKKRKNEKIKSSPVFKMEVIEECEEIPQVVGGSGKPQRKAKGPSVKELKTELKELRYQKRQPVKSYPISGRKKGELQESINQLRAM